MFHRGFRGFRGRGFQGLLPSPPPDIAPPPSGSVREIRHRVAAAEISIASFGGRANSPSAPVDSAASWSRRVAAVLNPVASATTAVTPGQRSATSIAHRRAPTVPGSAKTHLHTSRRAAAVVGASVRMKG